MRAWALVALCHRLLSDLPGDLQDAFKEEKESLPENFTDETRERGGWCMAILGVLMDGAENMESEARAAGSYLL